MNISLRKLEFSHKDQTNFIISPNIFSNGGRKTQLCLEEFLSYVNT